MGVANIHKQYAANAAKWQKCRDVIEGGDAVKAADDTYLPKLSGQKTDAEYQAYKERALFYEATARTVDGLVGAVCRKDPEVTVPDAMEDIVKDVTLAGEPLDVFAKYALEEVLSVGRLGILVDMPATAQDGARPYLSTYAAEQIVNWKATQVNGQQKLEWVVLQEESENPDPKDEFGLVGEIQYRVLKLEEGLYVVRVYRKSGQDEKSWIPVEEYLPQNKGQRLDYIPFVFVGPTTLFPDVEKSPISGLADVNLSHYRSSADLEHGRHFVALPTPWVAGFDTDKELRIGSSIAWVTSNTDAKAGMLEFTGQGLGALERALEEKEKKMAALGARLLEDQKKSAEAAETVRLRHSGESGVLQSIASTVGMALTQALRWMAEWIGADPEGVAVQLNTKLFDSRLTDTEMTALMALWQGAAISKETLYYNLERGELTRPGVDFETEEQEIAAGTPATTENAATEGAAQE